MSAAEPRQVVSGQVSWLGRWVFNHRRFWIRAGRLETRVQGERLSDIRIDKPVFITGLARAGTTILLELLADHPDAGTHKYQDYPFVFIPYWWEQYVRRARRGKPAPVERAHGDGIMITPGSPEAMEEPIWMSFFSHLHDPEQCNVLTAETQSSEFESFYANNIRKVMLRSASSRYVSKGNYNLTRMPYIRKQFPGARFVIPVRDPVSHIGSLVRQHERFLNLAEKDPEVVEYFRRAGHFEFGPDRRPLQADDPREVEQVLAAWRDGDEVLGWALYWNAVHGYLQRLLALDAELRDQVLLVPYEAFCGSSAEWIQRILEHVQLGVPSGFVEKWARRIKPAVARHSQFSEKDLDRIRHITEGTVRKLR